MKRDSRQPDDVLGLLRTRDPVGPATLAGAGIEHALDDLGVAIAARPRQAATSRRRRIGALFVAAAVLAIGAGVAAGAGVFSAHTGRYPTKAERAMGGPGEELNPTAPDFRTVALQVASDVPYPQGYASWRDAVISESSDPSQGIGAISTGALHGFFAASAFCAWVQTWRQASVARNADAATVAAQTIAQAPRWKAVTDEDPHPDPLAPNDPGAEPGTIFGWMLPYRAAVLSGDRARVDHLLVTGFGDGKCQSSDPHWMALVRAHEVGLHRLSQRQLERMYAHYLARGRS